MNRWFSTLLLACISACPLGPQLLAEIKESSISQVNQLYDKLVQNDKEKQKERAKLLRFMSYNMVCRDEEQPWEAQKARLLEYLAFARADLIGSQGLRQAQADELVGELNSVCGSSQYECYAEFTLEGGKKVNASPIFFNRERIELLDGATMALLDENNAETSCTACHFKDKRFGGEFIVINTNMNWIDVRHGPTALATIGLAARAFSAKQLPVVLLGDFNYSPFPPTREEEIPLREELVAQRLAQENFTSAEKRAGCLCVVPLEWSNKPKLLRHAVDHIFVNGRMKLMTCGVDPVKVDGRHPSAQLPVFADLSLL